MELNLLCDSSVFSILRELKIYLYSPTANSEIHNLKFDSSDNFYFIGSQGASNQNVVVGKINSDFTSSWQIAYAGNKMYSFEMKDSSIYFMIINSNAQFLVKASSTNGSITKSIYNSYTTSTWSSYGWKIIVDSINSNSLYVSGNGYMNHYFQLNILLNIDILFALKLNKMIFYLWK